MHKTLCGTATDNFWSDRRQLSVFMQGEGRPDKALKGLFGSPIGNPGILASLGIQFGNPGGYFRAMLGLFWVFSKAFVLYFQCFPFDFLLCSFPNLSPGILASLGNQLETQGDIQSHF